MKSAIAFSFFCALLIQTSCGGNGGGGSTTSLDPVIASFSVEQNPITTGTSTTLTAVFTNGDAVIDHGVGSVTSGIPITTGPLNSTTTFTLTVTNTAGVARTAQATVTVNPGIFVQTGSLNSARMNHTATLLPNGKVLIAGGGEVKAEIYDPGSGTFSYTGSMSYAHNGNTATLLPNGKVLIAGGWGVKAELYDPNSGTFTDTGSLTWARYGHTATLLANGMVLVAGGSTVPSGELYDPNSGVFTITGDSNLGLFHSATLLPDDTVFLVGRAYTATLSQRYYPSTGQFVSEGPPSTNSKWSHTATILPNGSVLFAGGMTIIGSNNVITSVAEYAIDNPYQPTNKQFVPTGNLITGRENHTATLLTSGPNAGRILVIGGQGGNGENLTSAELFDPSASNGFGDFISGGSLHTGRSQHTATLLPNGKVLVVGGSGYLNGSSITLSSAELFQ